VLNSISVVEPADPESVAAVVSSDESTVVDSSPEFNSVPVDVITGDAVVRSDPC